MLKLGHGSIKNCVPIQCGACLSPFCVWTNSLFYNLGRTATIRIWKIVVFLHSWRMKVFETKSWRPLERCKVEIYRHKKVIRTPWHPWWSMFYVWKLKYFRIFFQSEAYSPFTIFSTSSRHYVSFSPMKFWNVQLWCLCQSVNIKIYIYI